MIAGIARNSISAAYLDKGEFGGDIQFQYFASAPPPAASYSIRFTVCQVTA